MSSKNTVPVNPDLRTLQHEAHLQHCKTPQSGERLQSRLQLPAGGM